MKHALRLFVFASLLSICIPRATVAQAASVEVTPREGKPARLDVGKQLARLRKQQDDDDR